MKKKMMTLLIAVLCFIPSVRALDKAYVDWELDKGVFAHQVRGGADHVTNLALMSADGVPAYCIEPGVLADKASMYDTVFDIGQTQLGNIDVKRLSLIGYYGYGYPGHDKKEYYMAAQELIWRERGVQDVWWSDAKSGGNVINVDEYKDDILRLVNAYETAPKFSFKDKYIVGDEVKLQDENGVLGGYYVSSSNDNVKIEDNSIIINVKESDNSFTLSRNKNGKFPKFYYKTGYQTIASFEYAYDFEKNYKVTPVTGKIIIDKLDSESKSKKSASPLASLKGAKYGIYDASDKLISEKETDDDGRIVFDGLPKGNYSVRELNSSKGYVVSKTIHRTYLSSSRLEAVIKSYEDVIKNKIILTKVLEDTEKGMSVPEPNIIFHVHDENGVFYKEVITDENGVAEFELPYGNYVVKQVTAPTGIDKVKDVYISVKTADKVQKLVLVNKPIKEKRPRILPKTGKSNEVGFIMMSAFVLFGFINVKKSI